MFRYSALLAATVISLAVLGAPAFLGVGQGQAQLFLAGPSGGTGGGPFSDQFLDDPNRYRVVAIKVRSGDSIDALGLVYMDQDGRIYEPPLHGGRGGQLSVIFLDRDDYITAISGGYHDLVNLIEIHTKLRSKPYSFGAQTIGEWSDTWFYYEAPPGMEIFGLFGTSGTMIDSMGVIMRQREASDLYSASVLPSAAGTSSGSDTILEGDMHGAGGEEQDGQAAAAMEMSGNIGPVVASAIFGHLEEGATGAGSSVGAETAGDILMQDNTDMVGYNYRDFDLPGPDPQLCADACAREPECRACTYVKPGIQGSAARCWLKYDIPQSTADPCCSSGIKQEA
ncbi:MAG: Jacalin-like lectin domain protein [Methanosaeta sp. PtaB.Bin039]|nr:MAG: Jacalin-like lectin domain protein [Methanosaeta sp. PtaB.Bin039]